MSELERGIRDWKSYIVDVIYACFQAKSPKFVEWRLFEALEQVAEEVRRLLWILIILHISFQQRSERQRITRARLRVKPAMTKRSGPQFYEGEYIGENKNILYEHDVLSSHGLHHSTFGDERLNYRVRNGIGWSLSLWSRSYRIFCMRIYSIIKIAHPEGYIAFINHDPLWYTIKG